MQQAGITRKELSEHCKLPYHLINRLINERQPNTSMNVLLTLANVYQVSIGTLLGQEVKQNTNSHISDRDMGKNLKQFIVKNLDKKQEKPRRLATTLGFNEGAITSFLQEPPKTRILGVPIIFSLSKHWGVSIDEMIGRTAPAQSLVQEKETKASVPKELKGRLSPDGEKELESIKASLKGTTVPNSRSTTSPTPSPKIKKKEGVGMVG